MISTSFLNIKFIDIFILFNANKIEEVDTSFVAYTSAKLFKFTSNKAAILNSETYNTNTTFYFKNIAGSRAFSSPLSILHLNKDNKIPVFQTGFNYFNLLQFVYRLILLFLEKGSTKFRVYGLINDF